MKRLIFIFVILFLQGCSSEYTYKDINTKDDVGLEVTNHVIGATRLMLQDEITPFSGVIHQTVQDTSQDSLIIDEEGYPVVGKWKLYSGDKLIEEGFYSNRKKDSVWTSYFSNGNVKKIETLNNGIREGNWVSYFENGKINSKGLYVNGTRQGQWIKVSKATGNSETNIVYDTLFYIDGVTKREIARKKEAERKRRLEQERKERQMREIRRGIQESIQNKEYAGEYTFSEGGFIINLELKENGKAEVTSNIRQPYPTTQGTYEVFSDYIEFDDGDKCYKIELNMNDRSVIGGWTKLCFSWVKYNYGLLIAHEDKNTYYPMKNKYGY